MYGPRSVYPGSGYAASTAEANALSQGLYGASQAQAEAEANARSNVGSVVPWIPGVAPYTTLGASNAQARALANAIGGGRLGYWPTTVGIPNVGSIAQAEAEALAQSQTGGVGNAWSSAEANALANSLGVGYPGVGQAQSLAQAQADALSTGYGIGQSAANAQALANSAANSYLPGLYGPRGVYPTSGYASSAAEANALSQGLFGASQAQAEAEANARSNVGSVVPWITGVAPYSTLGASNAQARALANAIGGGRLGYWPTTVGIPNVGSIAQAEAEALAQSQTGGVGNAWSSAEANALANSLGVGYPGVGQAQSLAQAQADALSTGYGNGLGAANARGRVIPQHEYIMPHEIPGGENAIVCTREGELHHFWTPVLDCLVCACVNRLGYVRPVCVSCSRCGVTGPVPVPRVSCDPMPTEEPFENPTNPCEICVCHVIDDVFGNSDTKVVCQENPECINPIQASPLPGPRPHNSCRPHVPNVPFAHPWDGCQECVCTEVYATGVINVEVNCYTRRECYPLRVTRQLFPLQPFLIGCNVYMFQLVYNYVIARCNRHPDCGAVPWNIGGAISSADAYANARSNALNPFYPISGVSQSLAEAQAIANSNVRGLGALSGLAEAEALAKANAIGNSVYPTVLNPYSNMAEAAAEAVANANSGIMPGYGPAYVPGSSASALAEAEAISRGNMLLNPLYPAIRPGYSMGSAEARALANAMSANNGMGSAEAQALANAISTNNQILPNILPGYMPGSSASALAEAEAIARGNTGYYPISPVMPVGSSLAEAAAEAVANANSGIMPGYGPAYVPGSSASALAEAEAISRGNMLLNPLYPAIRPGYSMGSAEARALANAMSANNGMGSAEAQALANAISTNNQILPNILPGYMPGSSASALAEAEAIARGNTGYYPISPVMPVGSSLAEAAAEAVANANSGIMPGYGPAYVPGSSASALAEAEAISRGNMLLNPLYPAIRPGYSMGSAEARALANAMSANNGMGSAEAQALANAISTNNQILPNILPGYMPGSSASALAEAEAIARGNTGYYPGIMQSGSIADARANANANSGMGIYPMAYRPGSSASAEAEAIANSGVYSDGLMPWSPLSQSVAQSQAIANAVGQNLGGAQSLAQAQAQADAMSGGPLIKAVSQCQEQGRTPHEQEHIYVDNVAGFGDAEHRGPAWYSMGSQESQGSKSTAFSSEETSSDFTESFASSKSSEASSKETSNEKIATRAYRKCDPCPHDMLKKYTNKGIKWICGGYQRARRTFKSECMMRFRNCQDGTMFIKLYNHRCKNDNYHGRHWFYIYKV
ncbi:unnamed protein product [Parnassius mnemosyne]|uniref:Uncharacterized protein n=1 Tax=Parnassius mnemosyne TaxID=213953 RepID=A0AAV1LIW5_9NEOP